MVFTNLILGVNAPGGLWSILINWMHSGIGNFGWTILLVTLLVKLVVSPLDFWVKLNTKKQNLIQQKCAPQVAKINKKFGKDQQKVRIQTNELYKREGLNMGSGCLIMVLNMAISLTLFFTFYSSLRSNSAYQAISQYETLEQVYVNKTHQELYANKEKFDGTIYEITDDASSSDTFISDYNIALKCHEKITDGKEDEINLDEITGTTEHQNLEYYKKLYNDFNELVETVTSAASKEVVNKWNEIKSSWLWVDNIWVNDATIYPFPTYDNLVSFAKNGGYTDYVQNNIDHEQYNVISAIVNTKAGRTKNGYFILAILAGLVTYLSQYIAELNNRLKNKKAKELANATMDGSMQVSMKIMKFAMPVVMIVFVLQSSASFGIYILASNIASIGFGQISNLIVNKITHKKQVEVEEALEKEANRLIKKGKLQEKA